MLDSIIRVSKKYYPQILLEEYKYEIKKTKMENLINYDLDLSSSDDETDNGSDNETEFDSDEQYFNNNKSLFVCVYHSLLGFYLY